ncbi:hypothetical protein JK358_14705 [Nocardia sp. 2]|uniref:Uncharacterized protein n=1 Tax=Nocardia acididurans TaxID=2802282 RepID=A0ABS1M4R4_9NOCA|nr:hypothetical protein [Nocardia acididurans]MBL1075643.1 hypothetical protein [Nocardia acididurans]
MTEPSIDAVPEADLVEQHTPAYPDPEEPAGSDSELTPLPEGDNGWTASEADLIEQAIPVPLDDDYDESAGG